MLSKFETFDGKKWVWQLSLGDNCNNESHLGSLRVLESLCLIRKVVSVLCFATLNFNTGVPIKDSHLGNTQGEL
jgi:hypothetical protein